MMNPDQKRGETKTHFAVDDFPIQVTDERMIFNKESLPILFTVPDDILDFK